MDGIDGDGSGWSYLCASLFAREIAELGAMWHVIWIPAGPANIASMQKPLLSPKARAVSFFEVRPSHFALRSSKNNRPISQLAGSLYAPAVS